jgi:hypothetical protein
MRGGQNPVLQIETAREVNANTIAFLPSGVFSGA